MQVVLLERVEKLGQMGDVVSVKDGYARNFLLPQNKALRATTGNMERFEKERAQLETRNLELKKEAEAVKEKMDGEQFVILRQAGESGQLYGSVSSRDIADAATDGGFSVDRSQVVLNKPIKTLGLHDIKTSLHPEVQCTVVLNVARSEEEAIRQARGEDISAQTDEEDAVEIDSESIFENDEQAKEAIADAADDSDGDVANEDDSEAEKASE
jgi:large subunit ribosomal protein L9